MVWLIVIISSLLSFLVSRATAKMCFTKIDRYVETSIKQMQESVNWAIEQLTNRQQAGK